MKKPRIMPWGKGEPPKDVAVGDFPGPFVAADGQIIAPADLYAVPRLASGGIVESKAVDEPYHPSPYEMMTVGFYAKMSLYEKYEYHYRELNRTSNQAEVNFHSRRLMDVKIKLDNEERKHGRGRSDRGIESYGETARKKIIQIFSDSPPPTTGRTHIFRDTPEPNCSCTACEGLRGKRKHPLFT
jgi:hypothetical protein